MKITLVAARARNGVIGRAGGLPWRLKSDLAIFKRVTTGKPVIMGRRTWESLPRHPLPGRENIVISRDAGYDAPGARVFTNLKAALDHASRSGAAEACVIGGAQIYAAALPLADRLYLTEVQAEPKGDAHFPSFAEGGWTEATCEAHAAGPADDCAFVFRVLERRR
ncbi:MAG: dihydrofolate reductase [Maricaulaceae bacterium]|nr:dihydrofolate reductase [Maricaulaceae bacterium]